MEAVLQQRWTKRMKPSRAHTALSTANLLKYPLHSLKTSRKNSTLIDLGKEDALAQESRKAPSPQSLRTGG
eukprot:1147362-Pelagomonas_calceolata.AAC.10